MASNFENLMMVLYLEYCIAGRVCKDIGVPCFPVNHTISMVSQVVLHVTKNKSINNGQWTFYKRNDDKLKRLFFSCLFLATKNKMEHLKIMRTCLQLYECDEYCMKTRCAQQMEPFGQQNVKWNEMIECSLYKIWHKPNLWIKPKLDHSGQISSRL